MKNYYYILGVDFNASIDEIKKAYRKLSKKFHPDANHGDDDKFWEERFKEIQEAYETLSNETKRDNYDYKFKNYTKNNFNNYDKNEYEEKLKREYEEYKRKEKENYERKFQEENERLKNEFEEAKRKEKEKYEQTFKNDNFQTQNFNDDNSSKTIFIRKGFWILLFLLAIIVTIIFYYRNNSIKDTDDTINELSNEQNIEIIDNVKVEDFDTFYEKFCRNTTFQLERIKFPLDGFTMSDIDTDEDGFYDERKWEKSDWGRVLPYYKETDYTQSGSIFEIDKDVDKVVTKEYFPSSDGGFIMEFTKLSGKWYLTMAKLM